jgi:hypothetical protein
MALRTNTPAIGTCFAFSISRGIAADLKIGKQPGKESAPPYSIKGKGKKRGGNFGRAI